MAEGRFLALVAHSISRSRGVMPLSPRNAKTSRGSAGLSEILAGRFLLLDIRH